MSAFCRVDDAVSHSEEMLIMNIKYMRPSRDGARRIVGVANDGEDRGYYITPSLVDELSLYIGREIDEMAYDAIVREDEKYRAMKKALSILSLADNTARALYAKLLRGGFSREVAKECVEQCLSLGYIDEHRQLAIAVTREANTSLRGRAYIVRKLSGKGYRPNMIGEVIDELVASGEIDFSENFERLALRMGAADEEARRTLAYKYGYRTADFD